ncbi:universal stress protein [Auritidibacter ignavus]|uniref:universal stress protein n=1 Tax=Auritidibacter ignavus TaxID=678932 RepID=UPI002449AC64|nr:universal stress protein [Auritidibacter ignavus]WGH83608.1 universal stress protein [Auritidibacter ignavus]WGH85352.1 universal stress protein [Auritidibacter ignavus]WGH87639.1 universal stress protein [Auritidibacter ignavus]
MTILVGYKPSAESRAALRTALQIAERCGENVVVLNAGPGGEHRTSSSMTEETRRELNSILAASSATTEFREYARGNTTMDEFKTVAAEIRPSMIVIGIRHRSGFGRLMMGSVGDQILQEMHEPVLAVKATQDQDLTSPDATPEITGDADPKQVES